MSYKLVNPHIEGTFKKSITASSPDNAAKSVWENLSKHFTNNVPKFAFSIENSDGQLYHYQVAEKLEKDNTVNYKLKRLNVSSEKSNKLKSSLNKLEEQIGGKHKKKDDDSSSSSDSDSVSSEYYGTDILQKIRLQRLLNKNSPIVYWWYDPYVYDMTYFYTPTFVSTVTPYTVISTTVYY